MTGHTPGAAGGAEDEAVAELRASVGDAVVDAAEALDDLIMSNGIALDEERLDWLADWLARRDAEKWAEGYDAAQMDQEALLRIDWMTQHGLHQSLPPVYTEHIGAQLLAALNAEAVA